MHRTPSLATPRSIVGSLSRVLALVRKEFLHIRRDPRTLAVMFMIPIVQLVLLGYAATNDVEHLATAVLDHDRTPQSRELLNAYRASNYFDLVYFVEEERALRQLVDRGDAHAGLIVPAGYGQDQLLGNRSQVGFVIDGSDPTVAQTAFAAAQSIGQAFSAELLEERYHIDLDEQPASLVTIRGDGVYRPCDAIWRTTRDTRRRTTKAKPIRTSRQ